MARQPEWQAMSYQPFQFNNTAEFGVPVPKENRITGISKPEFSKLYTLHFARRNQSISDRFQAAGTSYEDTSIIVIRHNRDLCNRKVLLVRMDGKLYKVINYSINDDTFNSLDLLTLKHVERVG